MSSLFDLQVRISSRKNLPQVQDTHLVCSLPLLYLAFFLVLFLFQLCKDHARIWKVLTSLFFREMRNLWPLLVLLAQRPIGTNPSPPLVESSLQILGGKGRGLQSFVLQLKIFHSKYEWSLDLLSLTVEQMQKGHKDFSLEWIFIKHDLL